MTACQWQAVRSFARRRRPQGKGREANSERLNPGAHAWLAGTRLPWAGMRVRICHGTNPVKTRWRILQAPNFPLTPAKIRLTKILNLLI